ARLSTRPVCSIPDHGCGRSALPRARSTARIRDLTRKESSMRVFVRALVLLGLVLVAHPVSADEVIFMNGDRLTGKIESATGGKLILKTEAAGNVTIDLAKVKTFSTDAPVKLKLGEDAPVMESRVEAGPEGQVQGEISPSTPPQPIPI